MIKDFELLKRNYAKLAVKRCLNFPKGDSVRIFANFDQLDFIGMLVEECYLAGAARVYVNWTYTEIDRIIKEKTSLASLKALHPLTKQEIDFDVKNKVHHIYVVSILPNYLNGLDEERSSAEYLARRRYLMRRTNHTRDRAPFVFLTVPSESWAKFLFPQLTKEAAIEKMWRAIFFSSYINAKDPFKAWDDHCKKIEYYAKQLTKLKIKTLHFTSKNGTDIVVGLPDKYRFNSPVHKDYHNNRYWFPNLPCEECYTSPHRLKVDGVVYTSKPISMSGEVIQDAKFTLKHGRVIKVSAKQNEQLLKRFVNNSEEMHYLGELSLVPFSSPVNQTGVPIFYECTLDENMGCHFAIGSGFYYGYQNGASLSEKELTAKGINFADNHI
ncbi:MAG: aminopeptidase, partial [Bacilli bacterium]|nr:aminopeptidase [Bacilli bacterium]